MKVVDLDHLTTDNEMVISIITEQSRCCMDMFELVGWDSTSATYHVMATDKFFIPATSQDYDDGEIRGALSTELFRKWFLPRARSTMSSILKKW